MNREYASVNDRGELEFAEDGVTIKFLGRDVVVQFPTEELRNSVGKYRINGKYRPPCEAGYRLVDTGRWHVEENECRRIYETVEVAPVPPTVDDFNNALEDHLMQERIARGYDTREPSLYANSSVPRWRQDAADWIAHVDAVMTYGLSVINEFERTGVVPVLEEFKAGIPKVVWTFKEV